MNKNLIAANIALALICGFLGWQLYRSSARFEAENDLSRIPPMPDVKEKFGGLSPLQAPRQYNAAEFGVIPSQNLFSESRSMEEEAKEEPTPEVPELKDKPILVGVIMSGGKRRATIIDPKSRRGERRSVTKRPGDSYEGYVITEITENSIILEAGGRREIIPLYDSSKRPSKGGKTPILATRVVSFEPGASGGVVGSAPVRAGVQTRTPGTVVRPGQNARTMAQDARNVARSGQNARDVQSGARQAGGQTRGSQTQTRRSWNETIDSQGRRVIRTPFGDIVRPAPPKPPEKP